MTKKILVTGGLGFIGSHLVRHLIENEDCEIDIVDNLDNNSSTPDEIKTSEKVKEVFICSVKDLKFSKKYNWYKKTGICFTNADYIMSQMYTQPNSTSPVTRGGKACYAEGLTFASLTSPYLIPLIHCASMSWPHYTGRKLGSDATRGSENGCRKIYSTN